MKKVVVFILFMSLFSFMIGCNTYERDESQGKIVEKSLDSVIDMADNKETFVVMFTQSFCGDCKEASKIINDYLKNHNVTIYEVVLDKEGTSKEDIKKNKEKLEKIFSELNSTPYIYYVKDGKVFDKISEIPSEDVFNQWVVKNKLDLKK